MGIRVRNRSWGFRWGCGFRATGLFRVGTGVWVRAGVDWGQVSVWVVAGEGRWCTPQQPRCLEGLFCGLGTSAFPQDCSGGRGIGSSAQNSRVLGGVSQSTKRSDNCGVTGRFPVPFLAAPPVLDWALPGGSSVWC